jgi:hypothetical protein
MRLPPLRIGWTRVCSQRCSTASQLEAGGVVWCRVGTTLDGRGRRAVGVTGSARTNSFHQAAPTATDAISIRTANTGRADSIHQSRSTFIVGRLRASRGVRTRSSISRENSSFKLSNWPRIAVCFSRSVLGKRQCLMSRSSTASVSSSSCLGSVIRHSLR